jgi:superfamily I DNA/RNA helicase
MFLNDFALKKDTETEEAEDFDGKVILSTVHQAKGLEWEAVFIIDLTTNASSIKSLKTVTRKREKTFYVGQIRQNTLSRYTVTADD